MSAMRVDWRILEHGGRSVEAQIFEPEGGSRRLILFCPGFPGGGATLFEQRHAASLVEGGYRLAVLRHNGTRLDTPAAPSMVNYAGRLRQGRLRGETHLGAGPSTLEEWLHEPLTALGALADEHATISVIGNSFGALSALWSLTAPNAPTDKIHHLLLLAGAQGAVTGASDDIMRIWKPEFLAAPRVTARVGLSDPRTEIQTIRKTYETLPERVVRNLPTSIAITYLVVEQDEILTLSDTEAFRATIGDRGRIVLDKTCRAAPDPGLMAHDTPDLATETFLDLLAAPPCSIPTLS